MMRQSSRLTYMTPLYNLIFPETFFARIKFIDVQIINYTRLEGVT